MAEKTRVHVYVYGRVQGVYYRQSAVEKALELDLKGWVRNLENGGVEIVFEGDEISVAKMIKWCEEGSPMARVTRIEIGKQQYLDSFDDFIIKSTY